MADLKLKEEKTGRDKRRHRRFNTQLKAQFVSKESQRGGEGSTIIDFSRKGMRAKICTSGEINAGSSILLEVFIPGELDPITVKGTIKWVKQIKNGYISGVELSKELDEINLSKLHLYTTRNEKEKDESLRIQVISTGYRPASNPPKDRFIP